MKNVKRVRRDESPSDISPRGLAGQAPISSFSCTSFLPIFCNATRGLKSSESTKNRSFCDLYKNDKMRNAQRNRFGLRPHHSNRGTSRVRRGRDGQFLRR